MREPDPAESGAPSRIAYKFVVSDLHLGGGDPATEHWHAQQQSAWEGLLRATAPGGRYAGESVELIINGDCLDCLVAAPPLDDRDTTDVEAGVAKVERIAQAHTPWFAALSAFLRSPGRSVTFLIGNHDLELAFAPVRGLVRSAIGGPPGSVRFCLARAYRPAPDIIVEHGCQFDPWNAVIGLWDDAQDPSPASPRELEALPPEGQDESKSLELPWGSRYFYRVFAPISQRFPYFESLLPAPEQYMVLAVLCLYAPDLVVAGTRRARTLRTRPITEPPLAELSRGAEHEPAQLFLTALPEVVALQQEVWQRMGGALVPDNRGAAEHVAAIVAGLANGELPALRAIFAAHPTGPTAGHETLPAIDAAAAAALLRRGSQARLALIGHTHAERIYTVPSGTSERCTLVNTGTWCSRLAAPDSGAIDQRIAGWLRNPTSGLSPLADVTAFTYALLRVRTGMPTEVELRRAIPIETS